MYRASTGYKFILVVADKGTNFLETISLYRGVLINHMICKHGPHSYLIFNEDQVFLSNVIQYIYRSLGIKVKTICSYNHASLKTEWYIRTISEMIIKQLTDKGWMWTKYLQTCTYAYNSFASPVLHGLSPFQLTYCRPPNVLLQIETNLLEGTVGSFKEYYKLLRKRFAYSQKIV